MQSGCDPDSNLSEVLITTQKTNVERRHDLAVARHDSRRWFDRGPSNTSGNEITRRKVSS